MKTFPKPLSAEEEAYYMKKSREGDQEAREILILRNMRLVAHIVKKYQCPENEQEELLSIGTIGLIKAIATVDTDKGRLSTYAARCIENAILSQMRIGSLRRTILFSVRRDRRAFGCTGKVKDAARSSVDERAASVLVLRNWFKISSAVLAQRADNIIR